MCCFNGTMGRFVIGFKQVRIRGWMLIDLENLRCQPHILHDIFH